MRGGLRAWLPVLVMTGITAGFVHAELTVPAPPAADVRCFEDGSCTDGYCDPAAPCDDSRDEVTQ